VKTTRGGRRFTKKTHEVAGIAIFRQHVGTENNGLPEQRNRLTGGEAVALSICDFPS
jgi:hypothetical protein